MLDRVINQTNQYLATMPKKARKMYGQFFTSKDTALFMANLFKVTDSVETISILDPGAGSGVLSCAIIDVLQSKKNLKLIKLTCYENDEKILNLLKSNLDFNNMLGKAREQKKYDIVIGNPPYMKISKDASESIAMSSICYGAPNLYFLFTAMSLFNLMR